MPLVNLVKIPVQTINLSPGSHLLIEDVTWEQYEALLEDLGGPGLCHGHQHDAAHLQTAAAAIG